MDPAERSRVLAQLQRRLHDALQPPLQAMFDTLDARLFDLAERSRVASQQQVFFEGLRECRRKRNDIEHDFLEGVADALSVPGCDLRLFGKPESFTKRRMGVAVATGANTDEARGRAKLAASKVKPVVA